MPRGDGKGPMGKGPQSGWGNGPCASTNVDETEAGSKPGMNPPDGRGGQSGGKIQQGTGPGCRGQGGSGQGGGRGGQGGGRGQGGGGQGRGQGGGGQGGQGGGGKGLTGGGFGRNQMGAKGSVPEPEPDVD